MRNIINEIYIKNIVRNNIKNVLKEHYWDSYEGGYETYPEENFNLGPDDYYDEMLRQENGGMDYEIPDGEEYEFGMGEPNNQPQVEKPKTFANGMPKPHKVNLDGTLNENRIRQIIIRNLK